MSEGASLVVSDDDSDEFGDYASASTLATPSTAAKRDDLPPMLANKPVLPPPEPLQGGALRKAQQLSNQLKRALKQLESGKGLNATQRVAWEQRRRLPA